MRVLITGINGFVGKYLRDYLQINSVEVFGTSRYETENKNVYQMDLGMEESIIRVLKTIKPTHIFHLAGMTSVRDSWSNKVEVFQANTIGTINLLEAVKKIDNSIKVITIGSAEEYGPVQNIGQKISEYQVLNPINPYGVSKASISMLVKQYYQSYKMNIVHVRPFNHIGPGQRLGFVASDFAYQIALIHKGKIQPNVINVGNLEAVRDFTDVRDIVKAYLAIAIKGIPGEIYNVCSSKGTKIREMLNIYLSFTNENIIIKSSSTDIRALEVNHLVGNHSKLTELTGWKAEKSLDETLLNIYQYWLDEI